MQLFDPGKMRKQQIAVFLQRMVECWGKYASRASDIGGRCFPPPTKIRYSSIHLEGHRDRQDIFRENENTRNY